MPRNSKVIGIEQSLGLVSERGISRRGYKDAPPMQELLRGVKEISLRYVHHAPADIRDSRPLQKDAEDLFARIGEKVWPATDGPRPSWLADPAKDTLGGKYKRELRFSNLADRPELRKHFVKLVIEKTCILHDNEQAKIRRLRQGQPEPFSPSGDDEVASDGDLTMQDSPAPPTAACTTRSSLATPSSAAKTTPADEPRRGFQAVNQTPVNRNSAVHGGNARDMSAPTPAVAAPPVKTPSIDTKVTPKQEERAAHDTPTKAASSRVTRKRASTTEQTATSKKSCVAVGGGVDTVEDSLPIRSAKESPSGSPRAPSPVDAQKKAQPSERSQTRSRRESTRAAAQAKSPEKRKRPNQPPISSPVSPSGLMQTILGDLANCASVSELARACPDIKYNRHMLETIKNTLQQNPDCKDNLDFFHDTLQEVTGHNPDQAAALHPTPKPEGRTVVATRGAALEDAGRPLALVEMNWGHDTDFIDAFELPLLKNVDDFFHLVETHMPHELRTSGRKLKEITVTAVTDVIGRKVNFRISSDPERGRGSLRLLMHRLRLHAPGVDDEIETELIFTAVWGE